MEARNAARRFGVPGKGRLAPVPVLLLDFSLDIKFRKVWEEVEGWRGGEWGGVVVGGGPNAAMAAWVNSVSLPLTVKEKRV